MGGQVAKKDSSKPPADGKPILVAWNILFLYEFLQLGGQMSLAYISLINFNSYLEHTLRIKCWAQLARLANTKVCHGYKRKKWAVIGYIISISLQKRIMPIASVYPQNLTQSLATVNIQ